LAERCLGLGWHVIALDAFADYYSDTLKRRNLAQIADHPSCTVIEGDLLEVDLAPILADVSIVFHLAAQPGVRTSWADFSQYTLRNVNATQRLLEAARNAAIDRLVLASTSSVYGDAATLPTPETVTPRPVSPYGVTKLATEHLAQVYWRSFGVPAVCLRYFTVYGPRQRPDMAFNRMIRRALAQESFQVFGDGNQTRDFTFVADAVSGTVAAGKYGRAGSVYNIGGGSRRSLKSVLDVLGELLEERVAVSYSAQQPGDARDTAADIRRAREELGFEPAVDFESGLKAQLDWQQASLPSAQPVLSGR
jgi:UDP-glucose 4-epimerase